MIMNIIMLLFHISVLGGAIDESGDLEKP